MVYKTYTVGQYIVDRLRELGVRHLFSVPGPYGAEWLHDYVEATPDIQRFGTTNAANAGYAADGYARMNGLGAVCVPYGVGSRALLNPVAGAFVERVPMIVVNGAPSPEAGDAAGRPPARPLVGGPDGNRRLYDDVTCATARLTDPAHAPAQIDHLLLSCLRHRRPVHLELQTDLLHRPCSAPQAALSLPTPSPASDVSRSEALLSLASTLSRADSLVVWGGIELQRYGLEQEFDALLRALDVPYVTSLLGKGLLPEDHDHFAGILNADSTSAPVRALLAEADHVLGIGVGPSLDAVPSGLAPDRTTILHSGPPRPDAPPATHAVPSGVAFRALLEHLRTEVASALSFAPPTAPAASTGAPNAPSSPASDARMTYQGVFDTIAPYVDDDTILVSGTGLDRFGSQSLPVSTPSGFVCQAVYGDVGHAPPAAMGVDLGSGDERVMVVVGDGGFQMTAPCLGTMAEKGLDPLVLVLNNGVYASEQRRTDATPFAQEVPFAPQNLLQQWHYRKLPDALGGRGWRAETPGQLTDAVEEALAYTGGPLLIDVRIRQKSLPDLAVDGLEQPAEGEGGANAVLGSLP
jgi:indolepyruvate decarboxylase